MITELVRFITHPEVHSDPDLDRSRWGLSPKGRARVNAFVQTDALRGTKVVICSPETYAVETAEPLANALRAPLEIHPSLHQARRGEGGQLIGASQAEAEEHFYTVPEASIRGWERAVDAQARVCRAVENALKIAPKGDILIVGHGTVGTLLFCSLAGLAISRKHDEPAGGGHGFAFHRHDRQILHAWTPIEQMRAREMGYH